MQPLERTTLTLPKRSRLLSSPHAIAVYVLILIAAGIAVGVWIDRRMEMRRWMNGLNSSEAPVRAKSCYRIGSRPTPAVVDAVCELLRSEQDPDVCEAACYALQKMEATDRLGLIGETIARLPDCPPLSKIIGYYVFLGGQQVLDDLREFANSGRTFTELGAGLGLLELDDVSGAEILLRYAAAQDPSVREYAAYLLRRYSEPMMEMVGQPEDLATPDGQGFSESQLAVVNTWWSERDRTRELRDYNDWTRRDDPQWHQLKRLKHARERASRFLGLDE
ncbi:MAG: HEAT repeat domain-containing protein [Phycisphaerales bacterium]|nr:MAG: HEAT repeat domain-containing protein [Phycisphaerales bacterium]